jgi:hypothetical protein
MAKTRKDPIGMPAAKDEPMATLEVRSAKTGQVVTVRGVGALKGRDLKLDRRVSLLKPIAEQAFARRAIKDESK